MLLFPVKFDGRIFVKCDGHRIIGPKSRAIALQQHQGIPFLAKDTQVILQDVGAQKYKTVSLVTCSKEATASHKCPHNTKEPSKSRRSSASLVRWPYYYLYSFILAYSNMNFLMRNYTARRIESCQKDDAE